MRKCLLNKCFVNQYGPLNSTQVASSFLEPRTGARYEGRIGNKFEVKAVKRSPMLAVDSNHRMSFNELVDESNQGQGSRRCGAGA